MNREYWENNVPNSNRMIIFDRLYDFANEAIGKGNFVISYRKTQITFMLTGRNVALAGFYPQTVETFKFAVKLTHDRVYDEWVNEIRSKYNLKKYDKRRKTRHSDSIDWGYEFALSPADVGDDKKEAFIELFRKSYEIHRYMSVL